MWDDEGNYLGPADDTDLTGVDTQDTVLDITANDVADSSFPEISEPPPTEDQVPTYMFDEPPPEADFMPTHIPDEPAPSIESVPTGPAPDEPPPTEYNFFETAVDQAVEPPYEPSEPAPTLEQVQASTPPDEPPPVAAIAAADLPTSSPPVEPPPTEPITAESVPTSPAPERDTLGRAVEFGLQAASYTPFGQIIKATEDPLVAGLLNALQIPQRAIFGGIAGLMRGENVLEGAAKGIADPSFGGGALLDVVSEETGAPISPVVHAVGSVILDVVADPINLIPFGAAGKALEKVPLLRRVGQSKLMAEEIDATNLVTDLFADNLDAVTLSQEFVARPALDAVERMLPDLLKQFVTRDDAGKYALKSQQLARATSYINAKELTPEDLIKLSEGVELPVTSELPENVLRSIREMEPEIKRFVKDTPKAREATQVAVTALKQLDPTGAQLVQDAFDEGNLERLLVLAHASGDQALEKSLKTLSDRWDGVLPTNVLDAAAHSRLSKWMNKENIRLPDPNIAHDLYQAFKQGYLYLSPRYHVNNQLDFVGKFFGVEGGSIKSLFNLDDVHNALGLPKTARQVDIQAGSIALSDDPLNRRVGWEKMPLGVGDAIRWVGQKVQGVGELFDSRVIVKQRTLEAYQITRKAVIPKLDKYFADAMQLATSPEEAQLVTGIQQKVMGAIKSGRLLSMNDLKQLGGEIKLGKVLDADWVTGPPVVFGADGRSFVYPPTNSQVSDALKLLDDELRKGLQTQGQASATAKKVFDDAIKEVGLAHKKQLAHLQAQKVENLPEIQFELFASHQRAMSALQDAEHPQHILEGLRAFRWTEDLSAGIAKATREQVERLTADLAELKKTDLVKAGYMEDIIHDLWENSDRSRVEAWTAFLESVDDLLANPISGGPPELLRAAKAARNQVRDVVTEQNRQVHAALDALKPKRKKGTPPVVETPEAAAARIAKRGAIFDAREAPILKAVRDAVAGLEGGFRAVGVDPDAFKPTERVRTPTLDDTSSTASKAHARKMATDAFDDAESTLNTNTTEILDYIAAWRTKALAELPQALRTPLQAVPPELVDRTLKRVYSTWTNLLEHSAHFGDTEARRILNDYQSGKTKIDHALNLISPFSMWQLRNISYYGDAMIRNPRIPYVVGKYLELSESEREKSGKPLLFLGSLPVGKPGGVFGENEVWINPVSPFLTGLQQAYQLINAKQRYDNAQKFGSEADKSKAAAELAGASAGGLSLYPFVQEFLTFFGFFGDKAVQVPLPRFPGGEAIEAGATLQPVPSVLKLFESLGVDPLGALTGWMIGEQRKRMPTLVPPTENNPTLQTMVERILLADVINGFLDYRTMMRALDSRTRETDTVFLGAKSRARLLVDEEKRWKATAGSFSQMYRRVTPEMQAVYKAQQDQRAIEQNALGDTLYAGDLADNEYKRNLLFNTGSAETLQAYRGTYVESDEEKRLLASYDEWIDMDPKARRNYLAQPDNVRLVAFLAWRKAQTDKSKDSVRDYIKEKQPTKPPEPFEVAGLGARGGIAPVAGSVTLRGELPAQTEVRRLEAIEKMVDAYNSFSTPEIRKVQEGKYPSGKAFYDALRAAGVYDRYTQLQKDQDAFVSANPRAALWRQFSDEEGARAKLYGLNPLEYSEVLTKQTGLSKTKRFVQWATITGTMGIIDGTQIVKPGGGTQDGTTSGLPAVITSKAATTGKGTGTTTTRPPTSTSRPATTPYVAPRGTTGYFTGNYRRGGGGGEGGGSPTSIYKLPPSGPYVPPQVVNPRVPVNPDVERTKAQNAYNTLSADQRVELKSGQPLSSKTEVALRQLWSRLGVLMPFLEWLNMIRTL